MGATIDDLSPKSFKIKIKGVELKCNPPRLSDALILAKTGDILENPQNYKSDDIRQAESDISDVIIRLIPEVKGRELGIDSLIEILGEIMQHIEPDDNKELKDNKVEITTQKRRGLANDFAPVLAFLYRLYSGKCAQRICEVIFRIGQRNVQA